MLLEAVEQADPVGGHSITYTARETFSAVVSHIGGSEVAEAARLAGREVYRVRLRRTDRTRRLDTTWRLRIPATGADYNVISVDLLTDITCVWLRIEGPVPAS